MPLRRRRDEVIDVLDAYPRLTHDDIQAALRYAADAVAHEVIVLPRAV